jgi:hypothetical protein
MSGRISHENESQWVKTVSLGIIEPTIETIVEEVCAELFMLFEFWKPQPDVWTGVLHGFLNSRVS